MSEKEEIKLDYEPVPTTIKGSCHCGRITFSGPCFTPFPFMHCHCNTDRKTAGHGGTIVNIMVEAEGFEFSDEENVKKTYNAIKDDGKVSEHTRHFCSFCGSALWASHETWPDWFWPFAGSIDTKLPPCPKGELINLMLEFKASWAIVNKGTDFQRYPNEGIAQWHKNRKLYGKPWLDDDGNLLEWVTKCQEQGLEALEE